MDSDYNEDDKETVSTCSYVTSNDKKPEEYEDLGMDLSDRMSEPLNSECVTSKREHTFDMEKEKTTIRPCTVPARKLARTKSKVSLDDTNKIRCMEVPETCCHVKMDEIMNLKDSTKKLLCLVEEIQSKIHCKSVLPEFPKLDNSIRNGNYVSTLPSITNIIGKKALKKLEDQTKLLDAIFIDDEKDDCSIYKRLTRKCHCLNQEQYNDFVIHFNEDTKYFTSTIGEIIKNMRILKKFLYIGGGYTKNALMFLNEGLTDSTHTEKVEMIQGCAYADICNVFEDLSVVVVCISWPCKYEHMGDTMSQALTAAFLYKLVQLEEGRRYLNFSSKITNDIKKVIRKKASKLEFDTLETLNSILNLLHPPMAEHLNVTYYCKPVDEDISIKTLNALSHYRSYMTLQEVCFNLDLLVNLSGQENGKMELTTQLPVMLTLFRTMMLEYDNSEINILITNILNNIVSRSMMKDQESVDLPKTMIVADVATEPIVMKNETNQVPIKKNNNAKKNKTSSQPFKNRQVSKRKVFQGVPHSINRSKKFNKDIRRSIIIVPLEEKIK